VRVTLIGLTDYFNRFNLNFATAKIPTSLTPHPGRPLLWLGTSITRVGRHLLWQNFHLD